MLILVFLSLPGSALPVYYFKVLEMKKSGNIKHKESFPEIGHVLVQENQLSAYLYINDSLNPLNINIAWAGYNYQFSVVPPLSPRALTTSPAPAKFTPLIEAIGKPFARGVIDPVLNPMGAQWQLTLEECFLSNLQNPQRGKTYRYGNLYVRYRGEYSASPSNVLLYGRRLLLLPASNVDRIRYSPFKTYSNADAEVTFELLGALALLFNSGSYPNLPPYQSLPEEQVPLPPPPYCSSPGESETEEGQATALTTSLEGLAITVEGQESQQHTRRVTGLFAVIIEETSTVIPYESEVFSIPHPFSGNRDPSNGFPDPDGGSAGSLAF